MCDPQFELRGARWRRAIKEGERSKPRRRSRCAGSRAWTPSCPPPPTSTAAHATPTPCWPTSATASSAPANARPWRPRWPAATRWWSCPPAAARASATSCPGLASEQLTIVVSPLIALMADQWKRLTAGGHPAVMIASGLPDEVARDAHARIRDGRARIVYCSPERFASPGFWEAISGREVDLLAVDEAHCISEWGHDFRPDYLRLPRVIERLGRPDRDGLHRHRDRGRLGRDLAAPGLAGAADGALRLRPPQPLLRHRRVRGQGLEGAQAGDAARTACADAANRPGDRLLRDAPRYRGGGPGAARERPRARRPTTPAWSPTSAPRPSTASWTATPT